MSRLSDEQRRVLKRLRARRALTLAECRCSSGRLPDAS
jgi:hypothetical protein